MHALLLIGWLRAVLLFVPLKRKEYVLAAGHYKVRALLLLYYLLLVPVFVLDSVVDLDLRVMFSSIKYFS